MSPRHIAAIARAKEGILTQSQAEVYRVVKAAEAGISRPEICTASGRLTSVVVDALYVLKQAGLIECVFRCARWSRWCVPQHKDAAVLAMLDMSGESSRDRSTQDRWVVQSLKARDRRRRTFGDYPEVTIVPASEANPLKVYAPRSVFEVATC